MKTNIIILAYLLFIAVGARGQSVGPAIFNNTGGSAVMGGNTYEWSVGELITASSISSSMVITQGVLQPFDATTGVPDLYLSNNLRVFPIPAENTVYLQPAFANGGTMHYVLQDMAGKTLSNNEVKLVTGNEKQSLDMSGYAAGNYMLKVVFTQGGKTYTAPYKIQKSR